MSSRPRNMKGLQKKQIGENDKINCWFEVILGYGAVDDKILVTDLMPFFGSWCSMFK